MRGHDSSTGNGPIPFYPVLIVAAYVINAWRDTAAGFGILLRPLAVAVVVTAVVLLIVRLAAPHRLGLTALVVTILLVLAGGDPGAVTDLASRLDQRIVPLWYALIFAAALVAAWIGVKQLRRPGAIAAFTRAANITAVALLLVVIITASFDGSAGPAVAEADLTGQRPVDRRPAAGSPDIYVLLLDAYPRADVLRDRYGYAAPSLVESLEDRGFNVADGSRANYLFTQQTLASMLQMRHLPDMPEVMQPLSGSANHALRMAILQNPVFEVLRGGGYEIVTVPNGDGSLALSSADRVVDTGEVSAFERHLIRRTALINALELLWPDWMPGQLRERVTGAFEVTADLAAELPDSPRFTFVHVPAPHAPLLFRADGSPQDVRDLHTFQADSPQALGLSREEYVAQSLEQLAYVDQLTLDLVDEIRSLTEDEAVIVVMSDHGFRIDVTFGDPQEPDLEERFGTLLAAFTPGRADLFGETPTNINLFPILLNAYLDADLECQPDRAYANGSGGYLDLNRVPEHDGKSPAECGRPEGVSSP